MFLILEKQCDPFRLRVHPPALPLFYSGTYGPKGGAEHPGEMGIQVIGIIFNYDFENCNSILSVHTVRLCFGPCTPYRGLGGGPEVQTDCKVNSFA